MGPGEVAAVAALLAVVLLARPSWAQKLPSRDEQLFNFHISHEEIFYDTKLLSDGLQVTTYLLKNRTRRLFFTVDEADTAVSIIVTPCASSLRWSLSLRKHIGGEEEEDYFVERDPLKQQAASLKQSEGFGKVWSYTGRRRSTYETPASPAGLYVLTLRSTEYDSSVLVYASTTPHSDYPYPELPSDPSVAVDDVSTETVSLSWKASRSHSHPLQYCISVNPRRNLHSHCAALGAIYGDAPPTAPPNAGFGFAWEKERRESEMASSPFRPSPEDTSLTCIGDKTSYTVNNLLPGKRYYIDVFAVNSATNRSTAYEGVRVKTQPSRKKIRIKDGKVVTAFIKGGKGSNLFHYKLKKPNSINIVLQPCFGTLQVVITKDGETLSQKVVSDFENILIANATAGRYFIEVSSVRPRSAYFKVVVSRKRKRIVYPRLPRNKSIKVFDDNENACDSLSVAWLATNQKQQYCLYLREIDDSETSLVRILRRWNKCLDPNARKRTEKVMCRNVRFKDRRRAVVTQKIRGLKPNKQYVIDVYAKKLGRKGLSLSYNSKLITTRNTC